MFFSRRIIIIPLGILIIIAAVWLVWRNWGAFNSVINTPATPLVTDISDQAPPTEIVGSPAVAEGNPVAAVPTEVALKNLSIMFAQRYGTYSTDAVGQNIKDLSPLLTALFYKQALQAAKSVDSALFYGVTTRVLTTEVVNSNNAGGLVQVKTQRAETFNRTDEPRLSYQTLTIRFLHVDNEWLVDGASWK